jgi:hypothetical protein
VGIDLEGPAPDLAVDRFHGGEPTALSKRLDHLG